METPRLLSRPLWLLDIDGVVNAVTGGSPPLHVWRSGWKQATYIGNTTGSKGFPLIWNERVVDFIASVHTEGLAEVVWHSSWRSEASRFGQIVGLPSFAISDAPEWSLYQGAFVRDQILARKPGWWKYPAVERAAAESQRAVLWTDDEIAFKLGTKHQDDLRALGRVKLVSPDLGTGLLHRHLKSIKEFLDESQP